MSFVVQAFKWVVIVALLIATLPPAVAQDRRPTAEAMNEDVSELTPYSSNGAIVKRSPRGPICVMSGPFEFLACGPSTIISLALAPGMYGSLDHTTTQGGQAAQFIDQLLGMGAVSGPGTLEELARQADAVDGSSINIIIPLIDYGFAGSFSNAAISMNRAHQKTHYSVFEAIGPRDALPGPEIGFPLSGQVTILEYTPWVLRGTFSALMVDKAQSDMTVDDPVLTAVHKLSGQFNIIGPWRGDDRAQVATREDLQRSVRQDLGSVFHPSGVGQTGADTTSYSPGPASSGTANGGGPACDCSCNLADQAPPVCLETCGGTFQACQGEPVAMLSDQHFAKQASLDITVENYTMQLRERFEANLKDRYDSQANLEEIVAGYLESFDDVADLNGRVMLIGSAGMSVDCPAPVEVADRMQMAEFMYCQFLPDQQQ